MSESDRKFLRGQLATIGIFLPEDNKPSSATVVEAKAPVVDRDEIRAVLVELGAPERDLDWMVASCPGLEYALTYVPTKREAWCVRCNGPMACDDEGCISCRSGEETSKP